LIKLCVGLRIDLNKDSKQPNLNPNQKAAQLRASCGFDTSKLPCSTINTCKAKVFIMQKTIYSNKPIINQETLDKIWDTDKHQSLAVLLTMGDVTTKCILTYLKRTFKASVYDIMGSTRKTR